MAVRRELAGAWIAGLAILVGYTQVPGFSGGAETSTPERLVYVFSSSEADQRTRAREIQDWVAALTDPVLLICLVRGEEADSAWPQGADPSFPALDSADLEQAGLPADVLTHVPEDGDYALLLTSDNALQWVVPGADVRARLEGAPKSTDINDSTWGKIKELFQ